VLYILTDLKHTRWLSYLLEEFCRCNRAEFSVKIVHQKIIENPAFVIEYSNSPSEEVCIPNRSHIQVNGQTTWLAENIFALKGTTTEDISYACPFDLFWNAFVFLSRLEEYESEVRGNKIQSYSFNHPRTDKTTFDIPVVNHLFNELEELIKKNFPGLSFAQKQKPIIEYSHDVDYIRKTFQLRGKQSALNVFNTLQFISKPAQFIKHAKKTVNFIFSNPSYWCFDYWEALEKKFHVCSVFYVYAQTGKKNLKTWLLDPSYEIATDDKLQQKLQHLIKEGFDIGLHGSFYSATDTAKLLKEKSVLEAAINTEVSKVRQHWLRYEERLTPYIHNKLFKYDSTLGWNDRLGFRSGCACRYRPYDHENQKPFDYMITPQVIMDSNIFDYGADRVHELTSKALSIIDQLHKFKTAHVSISWHQRVCSSDYGWNLLYEKILGRWSQSRQANYAIAPLSVHG